MTDFDRMGVTDQRVRAALPDKVDLYHGGAWHAPVDEQRSQVAIAALRHAEQR